jgi:hypothetical protein
MTEENLSWTIKKGKQNFSGFIHLLCNICLGGKYFDFPFIKELGHDKPCLPILKVLSPKGLK